MVGVVVRGYSLAFSLKMLNGEVGDILCYHFKFSSSNIGLLLNFVLSNFHRISPLYE